MPLLLSFNNCSGGGFQAQSLGAHALTNTLGTDTQPSPTPLGSQATWSNFMGANNVVANPLPASMGVSWLRFGNECSWPTTQPESNTYFFTNCDGSVKTAIQQNYRVVMMLAYVPAWAATSDGHAVADPQTAYDWATTMVKRYKPMGVNYYQVANEPTVQAGFWSGTDQQLAQTFLGPIQQAIKDNGGVVISPAWPVSNSITELIDDVLKVATPGGTYTNDTGKQIYQTVDMVDLHYSGLSSWQAVWAAFPAGTFKGLYQSEFGFTTNIGALSFNYVDMLYWALSPSGGNWQNDTSASAQYDFGLAWYSGCCATNAGTAPVNNNLSTDGTTLTENGIEASALNTALGSGVLSVYTNFSGASTPSYGFNVGANITIAVYSSDAQNLKVSGLTSQPASVNAIDFQGNAVSTTTSYSSGTETVSFSGAGNGVYVMIKR